MVAKTITEKFMIWFFFQSLPSKILARNQLERRIKDSIEFIGVSRSFFVHIYLLAYFYLWPFYVRIFEEKKYLTVDNNDKYLVKQIPLMVFRFKMWLCTRLNFTHFNAKIWIVNVNMALYFRLNYDTFLRNMYLFQFNRDNFTKNYLITWPYLVAMVPWKLMSRFSFFETKLKCNILRLAKNNSNSLTCLVNGKFFNFSCLIFHLFI